MYIFLQLFCSFGYPNVQAFHDTTKQIGVHLFENPAPGALKLGLRSSIFRRFSQVSRNESRDQRE